MEESGPMIGLIGEGWNVGYVAGEGLVDQVNICLIHLQEMIFFVRHIALKIHESTRKTL